jgi:chromosome segregation ATPase
VNELADLAALFGVPVTQLLEPKLLLEESDDLSSLEADIRKLEEEQGRLGKERAAALEAHGAASARLAEVSSELARVQYSLEIMRGWHTAASEEGDPG